jgi:predicted nucleotidyltransferase
MLYCDLCTFFIIYIFMNNCNRLTLEVAARCVLGDSESKESKRAFDYNEAARKRALTKTLVALDLIEKMGLSCGVFGSALRAGDYFHQSDVDIAVWNVGLAPIDASRALEARIACHQALGEQPFDLVLLPCTNEAFGQRIVSQWVRSRVEVERECAGLPMMEPVKFGPKDVAFIDADRLDIATRAAERMVRCAESLTEDPHWDRIKLSLCASMQTVVRVAEKCAKDVLREFAKIRPPAGDARPLYPLLVYPAQCLGGVRLANEASLAFYFECSEMLTPPECVDQAWAYRMALAAQKFSTLMRENFEPVLKAILISNEA